MAAPGTHGVSGMPYLRSKFVPFFSGEVDQDVEDFLDEYEEKANENNLTDTQKVETVIRYVVKTQHHIWKSLPGYIDRDWGDLRAQLRQQYINPSTEGQFLKQKLVDFVDKYARKRMDDEADVINYHRQFNTKGKFLLDSGRVTQGEFNAIFWRGFHREDRHALCERLIAKQPDRPQGRAFDIQDVLNIARAVFLGDNDFYSQEPPPQRDDIDRVREQRTERGTHNSREADRDGRAPRRVRTHEPPSFEGQESEDEEAPYSDQEQQASRGHRHSSARIDTRTVRFKDVKDESEDKDLEDLIFQLHDLPVRDHAYASLYARCARRFPDAMRGIPQPQSYRTDLSASYSYQATNPPPLNPQSWTHSIAPPPPTSTNAIPAATYFRPGPCVESCAFCRAEGHRVRSCALASEYVKSGRATYVNDRIHLPNSQPVPFDGTRQGLKGSINTWLATQSTPPPAPAQIHTVYTRDPPPHFNAHSPSTSRIEEVAESHIIQVADAVSPVEDEDQDFSNDIFEVFAAERKKTGKAPELSALPPPTQAIPPTSNASAASPSNLRHSTQYRYQCDAEDHQLVLELGEYLAQGQLSLTTPAHVLAASPAIRKELFDKLKVRRVETNGYEAVSTGDPETSPPFASAAHRTTVHDVATIRCSNPNNQNPDFCLPLQEIDVIINGSIKACSVLDTGSQIVVI